MVDDGDLEFQPCRVLDISLGGFKLLTQKHHKMGEDISVKLNKEKVFNGIVVRSRQINEENHCYTGVKLKESPESIDIKLKELDI